MSYAILGKVAQLMQHAVVVNQSTKFAVWLDYSGHVNSLKLRIAKGKERPQYHEALFDETLYLYKPDEVTTKTFDRWLEVLNNLMTGGEADDSTASKASDGVSAEDAQLAQ
jgi:hypothetical protein